MSILAAVHLTELRFGKFDHLKDGSQSCLAQSDLQESVNLQVIKNRIHNMIFSLYAREKTRKFDFLASRRHEFPIFSNLTPWASLGGLQLPNFWLYAHSGCKLAVSTLTDFSSLFTYGCDFCSFGLFLIFAKCFKVNDFS